MKKKLVVAVVLALLTMGSSASFAHFEENHCKHCDSNSNCSDYHSDTWNPGWTKCKTFIILGYKLCFPENPCPAHVPGSG